MDSIELDKKNDIDIFNNTLYNRIQYFDHHDINTEILKKHYEYLSELSNSIKIIKETIIDINNNDNNNDNNNMNSIYKKIDKNDLYNICNQNNKEIVINYNDRLIQYIKLINETNNLFEKYMQDINNNNNNIDNVNKCTKNYIDFLKNIEKIYIFAMNETNDIHSVNFCIYTRNNIDISKIKLLMQLDKSYEISRIYNKKDDYKIILELMDKILYLGNNSYIVYIFIYIVLGKMNYYNRKHIYKYTPNNTPEQFKLINTGYVKYEGDYEQVKDIKNTKTNIDVSEVLVDLYQANINYLYKLDEYNIDEDIFYKYLQENKQYYCYSFFDHNSIHDETVNFFLSLCPERLVYIYKDEEKINTIDKIVYNNDTTLGIFEEILNEHKYKYLVKPDYVDNNSQFYLYTSMYHTIYLSSTTITNPKQIKKDDVIGPWMNIDQYFVQYDKSIQDAILIKYDNEKNLNERTINMKIILCKFLNKTDILFAITIGLYNFLISWGVFMYGYRSFDDHVNELLEIPEHLFEIYNISRRYRKKTSQQTKSFNKFIERETNRLNVMKFTVEEQQNIENIFSNQFGIKIDYSNIHMYTQIKNICCIPENNEYIKYVEYFRYKQINQYFKKNFENDLLYNKNNIL